MAAEPPTKTDREIATVWPRGTLELREQSIAFVPTANKVPIEWRFEEILSVECDAEGTVTMLECSHFDSRRAEPAFASTPHAAIPPSKRSVRVATSHAFATASSALKTPRAWTQNQAMCYGCVKPFDFFRRQHHCRQCGQAFCGDCCSKKYATAISNGGSGGGGGSTSSLEKTCLPCADAVASAAAAALAQASVAPEDEEGDEGSTSLTAAATQFASAAEKALAMGAPSSSNLTAGAPEAKDSKKKKVLVLINPFSGKKRAPQAWAKVAPLLKGCSRLDVEVLSTTHAGHATQLLHEMPQDQLPSVLVLCSGDGLVFEAVNGLLSRKDVAKCPSIAHQVSMLHLPGGTSNGLACSVGTEDPVSAALAIAKHLAVPWDAVAVNVGYGQWTGYAFSSMAWAVIADVDLGTEDLRWMGNARMDVGAAMRLCAGKKYAGKLAYTCDPISDDTVHDEEKVVAAADSAGLGGGGSASTVATTAEAPVGAADVAQFAASDAATDAPANDAATAPTAATAPAQSETTVTGPAALETTTTFAQDPPQSELLGAAALSRLDARDLTPVPSPDYFLWQACQLSVLDPGLLITPAARGWSGNLQMAWVTGADFTRMAAIKTMGLMETGHHLKEPVFNLVEVTGFVLDPDPRAKYMSVDGEAVPNGRMAAAVLPGALRVLVAPQVAAEYQKSL